MRKGVLSLAISEARKSKNYYKLGCVIFKNKKIISSGHNHSIRGCKKIRREFLKWDNSIHAEIDAIIKAKKDLKRASILVVRINNDGELRLARPCHYCMKYICYVGITDIFYSIPVYPFIVHERI